ncbi:MAG: 5'-3' exonuclease H3TH domain-containing protein [Candidatus Nealsonbacteria bacterium]
MENNKKRIIIIDSNSVIHRAYHALPPLSLKTGEVVGAVYGFLLVFFKAIKDFNPDFVAACFDFPAPTFRHQKYKQYKAKRPPAPEDLYSQIPRVKEFLAAFGVPVFEKEKFEADDIIGTIARLAPKKQAFPKIESIILSGDLDALQLVDEQTKVFALRKGVKDVVLYDKESTKEKFQGLVPGQLLDYKALRGDASDNIPGVTGIGEKTTIDLLLRFGSLDNIYREIEKKSEKADKIKPKTKELLLKYKEQALLSRQLAKIETNVPIEFNLKDCRWGIFDKKKVTDLLESFQFYSLADRIPGGEKKEKPVGENLKLW